MNARQQTLAANRDAIALARAYQHDQHQAAAEIIGHMTVEERTRVLQAAAHLLAVALTAISRRDNTPVDHYIDQSILPALNQLDNQPGPHIE